MRQESAPRVPSHTNGGRLVRSRCVKFFSVNMQDFNLKVKCVREKKQQLSLSLPLPQLPVSYGGPAHTNMDTSSSAFFFVGLSEDASVLAKYYKY